MKKIICFIIVFICILSNNSYATDVELMNEQKELFGISDFVEETEKYTGDFFEDIEIGELLINAIEGNIDNNTILKKVITLLGIEV